MVHNTIALISYRSILHVPLFLVLVLATTTSTSRSTEVLVLVAAIGYDHRRCTHCYHSAISAQQYDRN